MKVIAITLPNQEDGNLLHALAWYNILHAQSSYSVLLLLILTTLKYLYFTFCYKEKVCTKLRLENPKAGENHEAHFAEFSHFAYKALILPHSYTRVVKDEI